jgi:hypothetical protein
VKKAVKIIKDTANKLQLQDKPISYAQAARTGGTEGTESTKAALRMALDAPQKIHSKKEKRVTIKILNKTEAEVIRHQTKEKIVARIQQCVGGKNASHTILAVRQLKSGDLIVHMNSAAEKKEIKKQKS